ncbi:unnamed protein product [Urochloa humidicola]
MVLHQQQLSLGLVALLIARTASFPSGLLQQQHPIHDSTAAHGLVNARDGGTALAAPIGCVVPFGPVIPADHLADVRQHPERLPVAGDSDALLVSGGGGGSVGGEQPAIEGDNPHLFVDDDGFEGADRALAVPDLHFRHAAQVIGLPPRLRNAPISASRRWIVASATVAPDAAASCSASSAAFRSP